MYIDVLERTLYNGMISGVSLNGDSFFYPNCLESDGKYAFNQGALTRKQWFDCSCCPSNIIRFLPSVPDYIYAQKDDSVYVNLFIASDADLTVGRKKVEISQKTDYPWNGKVEFSITTAKEVDFTLKIRIPGWAQGSPVPGDLYSYFEKEPGDFEIRINGEPYSTDLKKGYADISRKWSHGDVIELVLPMRIQRVLADENVTENIGKVALERGPIVYCAEWIDNGDKVLGLAIADDAELTSEYRQDLLGGLTVIKGKAIRKNGQKTDLMAIPYYAWSHRGTGEMTVWFKRHSDS
jgi:DUF1680 family protein